MSKILDLDSTPVPTPYPNTFVSTLLDFEGLGRIARPVIVGVAAAAFGIDENGAGWAAPLCASWPITTRGQEDRELDHETLGWWLAQPDEVREPVSRALGHGSREGLSTLKAATIAVWDAAGRVGSRRWYAKPAAYDLSIWWRLVEEYVGASKIQGKLRDARTLWEDCELATGHCVVEPTNLGPKHDPRVDALATAAACADALERLVVARRSAATVVEGDSVYYGH